MKPVGRKTVDPPGLVGRPKGRPAKPNALYKNTVLRWPKGQLETVQDAAARIGIPYTTYVRDSAIRRALEDLQRLEALDL